MKKTYKIRFDWVCAVLLVIAGIVGKYAEINDDTMLAIVIGIAIAGASIEVETKEDKPYLG